jgi:hypothetical protein
MLASIKELWTNMQNVDGAELRALLDSHASVATYNEEREAIQFHCSVGNLIASLPLTDAQASSLSGIAH